MVQQVEQKAWRNRPPGACARNGPAGIPVICRLNSGQSGSVRRRPGSGREGVQPDGAGGNAQALWRGFIMIWAADGALLSTMVRRGASGKTRPPGMVGLDVHWDTACSKKYPTADPKRPCQAGGHSGRAPCAIEAVGEDAMPVALE